MRLKAEKEAKGKWKELLKLNCFPHERSSSLKDLSKVKKRDYGKQPTEFGNYVFLTACFNLDTISYCPTMEEEATKAFTLLLLPSP